jgi:RNA 3'-terminal phosphate cyclase (ATP)
MITLDGSQGEGGGQIVRSSLALSLVTGEPVTIDRIRARRKKPGLLRQHLTAVRAATSISEAEVEGAEIRSRRLVFRPGKIKAGEYMFRIGTAGSTTLVLQTILPALLLADGVSTVTLEGGTHNPSAPPFDFLTRVYLPLLGRMGPQVSATLDRPGFFPAGGGRLRMTVHPGRDLGWLELLERGEILERKVHVLISRLPRHIAERECQTIAERTGWDRSCFEVEEVENSAGPGNVVMVQLQSDHVTELFTGFGQRGVRAETVASQVCDEARRYLDADVPVGEHLADQLLLPLGIGACRGTGGGAFRTFRLTQHATTHIEVLKAFLDVRIEVEEQDQDRCVVRVGG